MKRYYRFLVPVGLVAIIVFLWLVLRSGSPTKGPGSEASEPDASAETAPPLTQDPNAPTPPELKNQAPLSQSFQTVNYNDPDKGAISGRVTDLLDQPVRFLAVEVIPFSAIQQPAQFYSTQKVFTDKNGYYLFQGLEPQTYLFMCGTTRENLPVPAGRMLVRDIKMVGSAAVSGEILDNTQRRLFPANVYLFGGDQRFVSRTNESGYFEVRGLPPGTYQIAARSEGFVPSPLSEILIANGEEKSGIRIVLEIGGTAAGYVRTDKGLPVAGAGVSSQFSPARVGSQNTKTDSSGYFELNGLSAGDVILFVLTEGSYERPGATVKIVPGKTTAVNITLKGSASINGVVNPSVGDSLPDDLTVVIQYNVRDSRGEQYFRQSPGQDGRFRLTNLETGTYRLSLQSADKQFILPEARTIELADGSEERVALPLERGCKLDVVVANKENVPAAKAPLRLSVQDSAGKNTSRSGVTDEEGRCSFEGLSSGYGVLECNVPGYLPGKQENIRLIKATRQSVRLTLDRGCEIEGTVYWETGQSIPRANVYARPHGDVSFKALPQIVTGEDGRYRLSGLPPGKYIVYAIARHPEYGDRVSSATQYVTIDGPSTIIRLDFRLRAFR